MSGNLGLPSHSARMQLALFFGRVAWRHTLGQKSASIRGMIGRPSMFPDIDGTLPPEKFSAMGPCTPLWKHHLLIVERFCSEVFT